MVLREMLIFLIFLYLPLSFLELSVGDVFYFFCSSFIFLINMEKKKEKKGEKKEKGSPCNDWCCANSQLVS